MWLEHTVLLGSGKPGIQRQHGGVRQLHSADRVGCITNLPLTAEEDEDVSRPLCAKLSDRITDRLILIAIVVTIIPVRPVTHLDREGPATDLQDRRIIEMPAEAFGVDGRARDDHLQVWPLRQELLEIAQEKVDGETALMGLIDDQGVVSAKQAIMLNLGQQDSIGHHLDQGLVTAVIGKPNLVAHNTSELHVELFGNAVGHTSRGDPSRLGMADLAVDSPTHVKKDLR